jgi:hypothetical protein
MEPIEVLKLLTDAPLAILLLYLLIAEQRAHAETRRGRDDDARKWVERFAVIAEERGGVSR